MTIRTALLCLPLIALSSLRAEVLWIEGESAPCVKQSAGPSYRRHDHSNGGRWAHGSAEVQDHVNDLRQATATTGIGNEHQTAIPWFAR